jgi:PhnB protein
MRGTRLFPRLVVSDADRAMKFYREAFGAEQVRCHRLPDGKVVHAELSIDGVSFYVKDADDGDGGPERFGGTPVFMSLYTDDADATFAAAVAAGAEVIYPLETWFYGERGGRLRDPFGQVWIVSTVLEELTDEEMARRMAEWSG